MHHSDTYQFYHFMFTVNEKNHLHIRADTEEACEQPTPPAGQHEAIKTPQLNFDKLKTQKINRFSK